MSNQKITDLSSLSQSSLDAAADFLLLVDSSNTSMSTAGTNVKINPKSLIGGGISDLSQTWDNASTVFTGLKLNITDTASDASSNLLDLQVGSLSKFRIAKDGTIYVNGSVFSLSNYLPLTGGTLTGQLSGTSAIFNSGGTCPSWHLAGTSNQIGVEFDTDGVRLKSYSGSALMYIANTWSGVRIANNFAIGWSSDTNDARAGTFDTRLVRDAANTVALRNGSNAQTLRIYRNHVDASNYYRAFIGWNGTTFEFGTQSAGTGGSASAKFILNGSTFIDFNSGGRIFLPYRDLRFGTWNGGNICLKMTAEFNGNLHVVDSLVESTYRNIVLGSLLFGGTTSSFPMIKNTSTAVNFRLADNSADAPITASTGTFSDSLTVTGNAGTYGLLVFTPTNVANYASFSASGSGDTFSRIAFGFDSGTPFLGLGPGNANRDFFLFREDGGTAGIRNSTNPMSLRIYNAYTDVSNYDRGYIRWSGNIFQIGTERFGTYTTNRNVHIISGTISMRLEGNSNGWGFYNSGFSILSGGTASASFGSGISVLINNRLTFAEITTPSTPAANNVTIYAKDNGSGKTQLVVLMPDGVETVLVTQT